MFDVGWLIISTANHVVLAGAVSDDYKRFGMCRTIPKSLIKSFRLLRVEAVKKKGRE